MAAHAFLTRALGALALTVLAAGVPRVSRAAPAAGGASDEIYRLGKDALARGSFEVAARLFRLLEEEPRFESDPRFAYNRAQASRYAGGPGEAVYWYGRYLALDPAASDAKTVRELIAKLSQASPKALRDEALRRLRAERARLRADAELEKALEDCPRVRLNVRFRRVNAQGIAVGDGGTAYMYPGRAVLFRFASDGGRKPQVWVVATEPVAVPEDLGAPLLLALPPGRPFPVELGGDLNSPPVLLPIPPLPYFPADPTQATWRAEVTVELDRSGPPILLIGARSGQTMVEVQSGPFDGSLVVGKKRRELPVTATPLSFGPRAPAADAKVFAGQPLLVVELVKEGTAQRWGAPVADFAVANAFGRLVEGPAGAERMYVRPEGAGPYLVPLK